MAKKFAQFVGKNWFNEREAIDKLAAQMGFTTNLKVKGEDVMDIDVNDKRITITMEPAGKIISFKQG